MSTGQVIGIQRRMRELGRIRMGDKAKSGAPQRIDVFRLTSASDRLLKAAAVIYGGTVQPWFGAPDEGHFELYTETAELDILLPPVLSFADGTPTAPYSQYYEHWQAGGCARRCDGETELISGKACMCDEDDRLCKITTRVSVMLPRVPDIGVWRLESHGWNAATTLPGTLELLAMAAHGNRFIPAVLRIEHRTKKVPGEGTRRFTVPVIDLPSTTAAELISGEGAAVPLAINAPAIAPPKPALPTARPELPDDATFANHDSEAEQIEFGAPPPLPSESTDTRAQNMDTLLLRNQLLDLARQLGAEEAANVSIGKNVRAHPNDHEAQQAWLLAQIELAQSTLVSRSADADQPATEGVEGSEYVKRAERAQARKAATK